MFIIESPSKRFQLPVKQTPVQGREISEQQVPMDDPMGILIIVVMITQTFL